MGSEVRDEDQGQEEEEVVKNKKSVQSSMHARLRQMCDEVTDLRVLGEEVLTNDRDPRTVTGAEVQRVRDLVESVNQCFHEWNAYRNVLVTE
jgi:hypothetical protein